MKEHTMIVGEFENELYAEVAKRDLMEAGIKAHILRDGGGVLFQLLNQAEAVKLIVPDAQLEEAKKILKTKFI